MLGITKSQRLFPIIHLVSLIGANVATAVFAQALNAQTVNDSQSCEIGPSGEFQTGYQIQTLQQPEEQETIVSARTPSQKEMTTPSLWWAVEQFDPLNGKLVANWQANKTTKVINLIVNDRFWRTLDYIDRYSFVNRFGTVAREYNYNLKVVSQEQDCIAIYTCDSTVTPPDCRIDFDVGFY